MEGPQFSTRAEAAPLPRLGRGRRRHDEPDGGEARPRGGDLLRVARARDRLRLLAGSDASAVSVETILEILAENADAARRSLREAVPRVDPSRACSCRDALRYAILTDPQGDPRGGEGTAASHRRTLPVTESGGRPSGSWSRGSVAFDYLMTFPGRFVEHLIPDRLSRLSVSFLVDDMRRVPRRMRPEHRLQPGAPGRDAAALRDGGAATPPIIGTASPREGVDVSGLLLHEDVFTASFFVSTDQDQNQIASFYTGAMARARDLSLEMLRSRRDRARRGLAQRPGRDGALHGRVPAVGDSLPLRPEPAGRPPLRRGIARRGSPGAAILVVNDYEFGILAHKTELSREELEDTDPGGRRDARRARVPRSPSAARRARRRATPSRPLCPEKERSIRPAWGTPSGRVSSAESGSGLRGARQDAWGASPRFSAWRPWAPSRRRYTRDQFRERYVRNFGDDPLLNDWTDLKDLKD